ncbi:MAG: hypothetical protein M1579_02410, partial [Gammaproteobacteria bacterium]|nr:hypothetical protein [Gammaproteobacteria bacterium]
MILKAIYFNQILSLTTGVDTITGTVGNDVINATGDTATAAATNKSTFTALDSLDGGAGNDVLNLSVTDNTFTTVGLGVTVKNIETVNVQATKAITFDSTDMSGVTNLNVTKSVDAATLTAANTTDVTVNQADAAVSVTGGKSVTINKSMDKAADSIVVNKSTDVTITATDSDAAAGGIAVGVGAGNAVKGVVSIESTGAKIAGGTGAVALDAINVTGGTTVSITQKATADMGDIATKGIITDVVTQGAVTVTSGATTTAVTLKQDTSVAAKAAVAAVAGVSATNVVTFVAMKKD